MSKRNTGALVGLGAGALYFMHSEAGQEKESNCSYLAPWTTDLGAVAAAAIVYTESPSDNFWLGLVAGAITAIHAGQFLHYKRNTSPRPVPLCNLRGR